MFIKFNIGHDSGIKNIVCIVNCREIITIFMSVLAKTVRRGLKTITVT